MLNSLQIPLASALSRLRSAKATLPVLELDKKIVRKKHGRIRPLPGKKHTLNVTAWNLYHAAKKAELTCSFNVETIDHLARSFAAEHHTMFVWNSGDLRLASGITDSYETAARSSRSRLIGEGMLLLTMQLEGYAFWDRFDVLVKRVLRNQVVSHPEMVKHARALRSKLKTSGVDKRSDFVIENSKAETALAEAKGSLLTPDSNSSIKTDLDYALKQLKRTKGLISPQPSKTFAVGTYLREVGDPHEDRSLIAFVDPEDDEESTLNVEIGDSVRRGNYAAWLLAMGFNEAALSLRSAIQHKGLRVTLPIKKIGGSAYAFVVSEAAVNFGRSTNFIRNYEYSWRYWPDWFCYGPGRNAVELMIAGIRVDALEAVTQSLENPLERSLQVIKPLFDLEITQFNGSVFPDGTMCGSISLESMKDVEFKEFVL